MNSRKKFGIATAAAGFALVMGGLVGTGTAAAGDTSHTLVVNGASYASYKESGPAWHFNTPAGITPITASVAERNQTWTGNGSDNLPCANGIHWISNSNVLTISHCLEAPTTTTSAPSTTAEIPTTTTEAPTTTTEAPTTTTENDDECVDSSDDHSSDDEGDDHSSDDHSSDDEGDDHSSDDHSSDDEGDDDCDEVTTTTIAPTTTTTIAPTTTTIVDGEGPTTTVAETTTTLPETTTTLESESGGPTTTAQAAEGPTTTVTSPTPGLPRTGSNQSMLVILGLAMILGGLIFIALTRRPDEV